MSDPVEAIQITVLCQHCGEEVDIDVEEITPYKMPDELWIESFCPSCRKAIVGHLVPGVPRNHEEEG